MRKHETKAIWTDVGTFRRNQVYPRIIQTYSEPCVTLAYLERWCIQNPAIFRARSIFKTLAYSQLWYIQNPDILRTLTYSKSLAYAAPCQTF